MKILASVTESDRENIWPIFIVMRCKIKYEKDTLPPPMLRGPENEKPIPDT